jgi:membrane fusion protein (multidrug efflux system)
VQDEAPRRPEPAPAPHLRRRRLIRPLLLVVVPALAGFVGLYWYGMSGRYVSTENAYVKADMVAISPDVDGRVVAVEVVENQFVGKGDILFRLDQEPFQIALDIAEAKMLAVRNDIEASRAEFRQIEAEIAEAAERVRFYEQQVERQRELQGRGIASEVRFEEAEVELLAARQRVAALREKLRTVLADTVVRAPVEGVVSRMRLEPGEWLEEGEPAFSIINPATAWIEANLKETQLEHVEVGQQVEIVADAYPNARWIGRVASISPATGAEFALIPPQNATGNWVKVVQRLPIRIAVEPRADQPALRAGMTVAVAIDTEREPELAKFFNRAVAAVRGED